MMNMPNMTAEDREWRAREDVRVLIEANKIKDDRERLLAAATVIEGMKEDAQNEAESFQDIDNLLQSLISK